MKIPVIAAGGISDARGFVAALALGAEGVLMGTRFMACQECNIHPKVKEWLLQLHETDTMLIQRSMKNTSRVVRTPYTEKIAEMEKRGAKLEELLPLLSGQRGRMAYDTGDFSQATISVGQTVGLIHDIPTAKEIIDRIISEARVIMQRLYKLGTGR
jgi:nitronate monooxygenase